MTLRELIDEAKRSSGEATEGPWRIEYGNEVHTHSDQGHLFGENGLTIEDAAFIASSRTNWPALAAKAEEMAKMLGAVSDELCNDDFGCVDANCSACIARRFLRAEGML